ncbi:hypothetical protein ERJ75_001736200 [Trypanosoma vivax]|uniref:Uncharacterized protein n=1 Tax=Trypanosoma vivax (strain Y486) TaxID=1055687 RepID=G0U316_TRYVY|nr:hypothetical protein TRVL_07326 [Trypanosoma vivax]KAH8604331.1 hypothetical protein ERJ75_001736200 [Trypanosoma vivax]CCC50671.1 conserved hypothetical protein [Trypanosoma vivax Y486]
MSLFADHGSIDIELDDQQDGSGSGSKEGANDSGRFYDALQEVRYSRTPSRRSASSSPDNRLQPERDAAGKPKGAGRGKRFIFSDPEAFKRLIVPTAASVARSQRKYIERKKSEVEAGNQVKTVSQKISPIATEAGNRLYTIAMRKMKEMAERRSKAKMLERAGEEKLTFQPKITSLAKSMSVGYKAPHERFTDIMDRLVKSRDMQEQKRLQRISAECTFHPAVEPASVKMAEARRKTEPFADVGERLCFEGGCRLIRQQLRKRILDQQAEGNIISGFRISAREAEKVVQRLHKWKNDCDLKNTIKMEEHIRSVTQFPFPTHRSQRHYSKPPFSSSLKPKPRGVSRSGSLEPVWSRRRMGRHTNLFYKYAASDTSSCLRLCDVRRQVEELFPEDEMLVAALETEFCDEEPISKIDFVECLCRFEEQHGYCIRNSVNDDQRCNQYTVEGRSLCGVQSQMEAGSRSTQCLRRAGSQCADVYPQEKDFEKGRGRSFRPIASSYEMRDVASRHAFSNRQARRTSVVGMCAGSLNDGRDVCARHSTGGCCAPTFVNKGIGASNEPLYSDHGATPPSRRRCRDAGRREVSPPEELPMSPHCERSASMDSVHVSSLTFDSNGSRSTQRPNDTTGEVDSVVLAAEMPPENNPRGKLGSNSLHRGHFSSTAPNKPHGRDRSVRGNPGVVGRNGSRVEHMTRDELIDEVRRVLSTSRKRNSANVSWA